VVRSAKAMLKRMEESSFGEKFKFQKLFNSFLKLVTDTLGYFLIKVKTVSELKISKYLSLM
jgi:hypothetical protein